MAILRYLTMITVSILVISFSQAMAQTQSTSSAITIMTDKTSYSDGDKMMISGTVASQLNVPISLVIKDPNQNIVLIGQTSPQADNTYSTQVTAGGSLWTIPGQYEVDVTYGSKDQTARTLFTFTGYHPIAITIQGVSYNATYTITNGNVESIAPNMDSKSLIISINPSGNGTLVITLPRSLIDAKTGGQDSQFAVQEDGAIVTVQENKTESSRTLIIPFTSASKQIEIIGTQIVPEFGSIAFAVLSATMLIGVFYTKFRTLPARN